MILRLFFSVLLGLILCMTSVTGAVAHMRAGGAMQIELCGTPGVVEVITLDAFGDPLPPGHHCPDCLTLTADAAPEAPQVIRPQGPVLALRRALTALALGPVAAPQPAARGPPVTL